MPTPDLKKHVDAFEWFINGEGAIRPDADRAALIQLGSIVTIAMERIAELERRLKQVEEPRDE